MLNELSKQPRAVQPYGRSPRLEVITAERTWDSYGLLGFLKTLPWSKVPRVVVLDNGSLHVSEVVRRARRELARRGDYLYYLPRYSPKLNEVEPVFRQVKYQEIPKRSHTSGAGLRESVEGGFAGHRRNLRPKRPRELRPAASRVPRGGSHAATRMSQFAAGGLIRIRQRHPGRRVRPRRSHGPDRRVRLPHPPLGRPDAGHGPPRGPRAPGPARHRDHRPF
jgi:hypothetical protein